MPSHSTLGRLARRAGRLLWPSQHVRLTGEGWLYLVVWAALVGVGLHQQINLILLTAGLAFGPIFASWFVSAEILRLVKATRRAPPYAFEGQPLLIDYALENTRPWTAALAMTVQDHLTPVDRAVSGAGGLTPRAFFARVPGRDRRHIRWQGSVAHRGRYRFGSTVLSTRGPFGLMERRIVVSEPQDIVVYPLVGHTTRKWHVRQLAATEASRGRKNDRSAQQREYHGLREYRPGDSPRWIHWRTSARVGKPMVKEFEQQQDQDLAVLIDAWLPRTKVTAEHREALESAIRFAATICQETCRHQGRRLILGWTGSAPSVRQGQSSIRLLHELLEQLAVLRASSGGHLSGLFDALPASAVREAMLIIVTTRPVNLLEEAERSTRFSGAAGRGVPARVVVLDASRGDLDSLIRFDGAPIVPAREEHPAPGAEVSR